MARPVVVVVDDEDASRQALARELERRYGAHYRIMPSVSPEEAHRPQQAIIASPAHQSTTRPACRSSESSTPAEQPEPEPLYRRRDKMAAAEDLR